MFQSSGVPWTSILVGGLLRFLKIFLRPFTTIVTGQKPKSRIENFLVEVILIEGILILIGHVDGVADRT